MVIQHCVPRNDPGDLLRLTHPGSAPKSVPAPRRRRKQSMDLRFAVATANVLTLQAHNTARSSD
eukprot:13725008-Alexandrium_andersonii.AAC.1